MHAITLAHFKRYGLPLQTHCHLTSRKVSKKMFSYFLKAACLGKFQYWDHLCSCFIFFMLVPLFFPRLHLCKLKNWQHYGTLTDLSSDRPLSPNQASLSNSSPTFSFDTIVSSTGLPETCKWKQTYMRAFHLDRNWVTGRYRVEPLLRGHKERVTCIDCDGKLTHMRTTC